MKANPILFQEISRSISRIDGSVGVYALHTEKGVFLDIRGQEKFPLASIYKIPIGLGFLRKVDLGLLNLEERVEISSDDICESSPILNNQHFSFPGISLSLRNLFRLMIEYSDNTASDLILKFSGGSGEIMKFLKELKYSEIQVNRSISQIFSEGKLKPEKALLSEKYDAGTPEKMCQLLAQIVNKDILTDSSRKFLLDCMYRCKTGSSRIKALLPKAVTVAHKTGTAQGFVNDIGIISLPEQTGKLILGVFIKNTNASLEESENMIAQISKLVFEDINSNDNSAK